MALHIPLVVYLWVELYTIENGGSCDEHGGIKDGAQVRFLLNFDLVVFGHDAQLIYMYPSYLDTYVGIQADSPSI
jgi:hypothetical protein